MDGIGTARPRPLAQDENYAGKSVTLPGILVGIPIGIIMIGVYICVRNVMKQPEKKATRDSEAIQGVFASAVPSRQSIISQEIRLSVALDWKELEEYRLDTKKLKRIKPLASGGYGCVWYGQYDNEQVAIKIMSDGRLRLACAVQKFIDEVKLMARLQHPNIIRFIGACWHSLDAVNLVVEYMNMGDLKDHLDTRFDSFPWHEKIRCAADVLKALVYLHDQRIIHRDIKSRNILMDNEKPFKLSDFGVSREIVSRTMSHEVGTFLWAAPEVLKGGQLTVAADIYSFGMLLSELDTHQVPFEGVLTEHGDIMVPMAIVMKVMQGKMKVSVSKACPRSIVALIHACTQYEVALRPTARELLNTLMSMRGECLTETGQLVELMGLVHCSVNQPGIQF